MEINHVGGPLGGGSGGEKGQNSDLPDSSIGEGMDITIQGANGHVKHRQPEQSSRADTGSLRSYGSHGSQQQMDSLKLPPIDDKQLGYSSDMSIGRGMDISIRGHGEPDNKEGYDDVGEDWDKDSRCDSREKIDLDQDQKDGDEGDAPVGTNVEEALFDPVDDITVEKCCPQACYNVCPCCIGDPDSPFWQLWYKHRLQMSRLVSFICIII